VSRAVYSLWQEGSPQNSISSSNSDDFSLLEKDKAEEADKDIMLERRYKISLWRSGTYICHCKRVKKIWCCLHKHLICVHGGRFFWDRRLVKRAESSLMDGPQ
jgi:hypothetical protein